MQHATRRNCSSAADMRETIGLLSAVISAINTEALWLHTIQNTWLSESKKWCREGNRTPMKSPSAGFESIFAPPAPRCTASHGAEQGPIYQLHESVFHVAQNGTEAHQMPVPTGTRTGTKVSLKRKGLRDFAQRTFCPLRVPQNGQNCVRRTILAQRSKTPMPLCLDPMQGRSPIERP